MKNAPSQAARLSSSLSSAVSASSSSSSSSSLSAISSLPSLSPSAASAGSASASPSVPAPTLPPHVRSRLMGMVVAVFAIVVAYCGLDSQRTFQSFNSISEKSCAFSSYSFTWLP
jgi:hypothetical protein